MKGHVMEHQCQGYFQIMEWNESTFSENANGSKQSHAKIKQTYHGDLMGESTLQYLMAYQTQANAVFVGYETINTTISNKRGQFIMQHTGTFENGVASSTFSIVEGSGTEQLVGISGQGSFKSTEGGKADYQLSYTL